MSTQTRARRTATAVADWCVASGYVCMATFIGHIAWELAHPTFFTLTFR